ncbi:dual specificity phosphatase 28 [Choloepus didactylus]|uniref:dual specificity phosphatase 28 n=1 Tax=Choloepus didactylus TaxID=27675 RepID=UPI0018A0D9F7|nr:dual specificity phosphatase 28 [Choloepus didactylus]
MGEEAAAPRSGRPMRTRPGPCGRAPLRHNPSRLGRARAAGVSRTGVRPASRRPGGPEAALRGRPPVYRQGPRTRCPRGAMGTGRAGIREAAETAPPPFVRVAPSLFLGSARAAGASELLARAGVTLCVNVSRQQPGLRAPGVAELRVPVFDDPAEDLLAHLEPTCAAMEAAVRAGGACLVYCKNGRSRSATVCTAYLMRHRGLSLAEAFQAVKRARPVAEPNPGFWSQLQKYEDVLQSQCCLPREPPGAVSSQECSTVKDGP